MRSWHQERGAKHTCLRGALELGLEPARAEKKGPEGLPARAWAGPACVQSDVASEAATAGEEWKVGRCPGKMEQRPLLPAPFVTRCPAAAPAWAQAAPLPEAPAETDAMGRRIGWKLPAPQT